ncbi:hypothetical protein PHYBLDRAFT_59309 [Phycomyces blakesleeanus NRRL 1555(-)]|uniref:Uncharacterized protein n=1 Tax=Phycomyces blakesleeanus (strain ATCC 8743b / DSM 1359 / FGSC 10004 / NBRC 33097 / NRRL 1555) TaxID=763407 RepID=A0A162PZJ1_PHYB8|nr:hypothetical protein PHYBLDRAFT_59309 [Phycomyces blakesleeanus NRRL 1555(-)]OAD75776.1 hypothetical protein PHYBLDRAFT_59309 [Phycomyces blakesleeanus NRRL 1555(-)]|eukprot:XP_018293816.1 hypothetical protein PHYBLDRAFT_59309 [Phycomyces blakesleeanus NRRL 1555(-)]
MRQLQYRISSSTFTSFNILQPQQPSNTLFSSSPESRVVSLLMNPKYYHFTDCYTAGTSVPHADTVPANNYTIESITSKENSMVLDLFHIFLRAHPIFPIKIIELKSNIVKSDLSDVSALNVKC